MAGQQHEPTVVLQRQPRRMPPAPSRASDIASLLTIAAGGMLDCSAA
jgi:hypothetical protein